MGLNVVVGWPTSQNDGVCLLKIQCGPKFESVRRSNIVRRDRRELANANLRDSSYNFFRHRSWAASRKSSKCQRASSLEDGDLGRCSSAKTIPNLIFRRSTLSSNARFLHAIMAHGGKL